MNDFFATIYELMISVYGDQLAGYLYGFCGSEEGIYGRVGLSLVIITILICGVFYFLYADSKRYKLKHWFLFLIVAAIFSGLVALFLPLNDLNSGLVCNEYVFNIENVIFFGVINSLLSGLLFFLISLGFKFIGKPDARYTPF